jgi:hypothetical protein
VGYEGRLGIRAVLAESAQLRQLTVEASARRGKGKGKAKGRGKGKEKTRARASVAAAYPLGITNGSSVDVTIGHRCWKARPTERPQYLEPGPGFISRGRI